MRPFEYAAVTSVSDAINLKVVRCGTFLAGGTDLLVKIKNEKVLPEILIDLKKIPGLTGFAIDNENLTIGALSTLREVETAPLVNTKIPLLAQSAAKVGSVQVRNRATIGGNLCNAAPSADTAPALLCLDAKVEISGRDYVRTEKLENFFIGPGRTTLKENEILTKIVVPCDSLHGSHGSVYYKLTTRKAMDVAFVGVAVYIRIIDGFIQTARIGLGAVAPTPVLAKAPEKLLQGQTLSVDLVRETCEAIVQACEPISDLRASAEYRLEMVRALTQRGLLEAYAQASHSS